LIANLNADVVVDMICFTPESAKHLVEALYEKIKRFLHCGTIWIHGHSISLPTKETQPRALFGKYGINKAGMTHWWLFLPKMAI